MTHTAHHHPDPVDRTELRGPDAELPGPGAGLPEPSAGRRGFAATLWSGLTAVTVPIFEASGHRDGLVVPTSSCSSEQAAKPSAPDGEIDIPSGNLTVASRKCAVANASLFSRPC